MPAPVRAPHITRCTEAIQEIPLYAINISGPLWLSGTFFDDPDVVQGSTYTYYIKASKSQFGSNESNMSEGDAGWIGFTTAPTATASDGIYTDRIAVTWNTVPSASTLHGLPVHLKHSQ